MKKNTFKRVAAVVSAAELLEFELQPAIARMQQAAKPKANFFLIMSPLLYYERFL